MPADATAEAEPYAPAFSVTVRPSEPGPHAYAFTVSAASVSFAYPGTKPFPDRWPIRLSSPR